MKNTVRLGISACLLGKKVRYDGTHKRDRFITDNLGKYVEFVPVCPEVEYGFGIPREPLNLVDDPGSPRLITVNTKKDYTEPMLRWCRERVLGLKGEGLSGFIFKSKSPSCGLMEVDIFNEKGVPIKKGAGIFARIFIRHFPLLPVEMEMRLYNFEVRESFLKRVFNLRRMERLMAQTKNLLPLNMHLASQLRNTEASSQKVKNYSEF